jgi:hypothetical protein
MVESIQTLRAKPTASFSYQTGVPEGPMVAVQLNRRDAG